MIPPQYSRLVIVGGPKSLVWVDIERDQTNPSKKQVSVSDIQFLHWREIQNVYRTFTFESGDLVVFAIPRKEYCTPDILRLSLSEALHSLGNKFAYQRFTLSFLILEDEYFSSQF